MVGPHSQGKEGAGALRSSPVRVPLVGIGAGILAWLLQRTLARSPEWGEAVAGNAVLREGRRGLSLLTGVVPFSLAELVTGITLLALGGWVFRALRPRAGSVAGAIASSRPATGAPPFTPAPIAASSRPALALLRLLGGVGFLYVGFQLLWGLQYTRPGVETFLGVEAAGEVDGDELAFLAEGAIRLMNLHYLEIHGVDDAGEPTPPPHRGAATRSLDEGWRLAVARWGLPHHLEEGHGAPKPFLFSGLVRRFGVSGMHFPFTGEALVQRHLPALATGTTLAHEMAHQRGVAVEADANVLAVLVARESTDARVRYAAYAFLHRQWLAALARIDGDRAVELASLRLPGVDRDIEALSTFWRPAAGVTGAVGSRVNDAMLRSQGVPEGVLSYRGSTWIFVALARKHGSGSLLPGWEGGADGDFPGAGEGAAPGPI